MSLDSLLGHEGTAARHYFGALATTLRGEIGFTARRQHFEPDPDRPGGIRATRAGLKIVLAEWEKYLLKLLRDAEGGEKIAVCPLMDRQIERLVADLRGKAPYRSFLYGD